MQSRTTSEETPTTDTTFESFFDADADAFDEDDFFPDFFTDFLLASMRRLNAFIGDTLVVGDAIGRGKDDHAGKTSKVSSSYRVPIIYGKARTDPQEED